MLGFTGMQFEAEYRLNSQVQTLPNCKFLWLLISKSDLFVSNECISSEVLLFWQLYNYIIILSLGIFVCLGIWNCYKKLAYFIYSSKFALLSAKFLLLVLLQCHILQQLHIYCKMSKLTESILEKKTRRLFVNL